MNSKKLFSDIALRFAEESHCLSKHVAAVAVKNDRIVCTGINGTPHGTENCDGHWIQEYLESDWRAKHRSFDGDVDAWKYGDALDQEMFKEWIKTDEWRQLHMDWSTKHEIHAEQNLIAEAARTGISLDGCYLYITLSPCIHCAKLLIALKPKAVYYVNKYDKAGPEVEDLFKSAKIVLEQVSTN